MVKSNLKFERELRILEVSEDYPMYCYFCKAPYDSSNAWYWCERGRVLYCYACMHKKGKSVIGCHWATGKEHQEWRIDRVEVKEDDVANGG